MALTRSFVRDAVMTPLDARLMNMASLVCNADGSPRAGVIGGANPSIVSALATWNFRVQAAEFATTKGKADGVTMPTNDGVVDVPIAAGAPASNSRFDVLWVRHADTTTGDATAVPAFAVTSGAAAASPTEPAAPSGSGWLKLATLRAYAGTTGASNGANVLTNVYTMTAARGGIVPVRTIAERDAWTAPLPVDGQLAFVLASDATYQYLATAPTPGWYHTGGAPELGTITPGALWVASGAAPTMRKHSGLVIGAGSIANSSAVNVAAGSEYIVANIADATFRPDVARYFATGTQSNAVPGVIRVDTNGDIVWRANATASWGIGGLRIDFGGIIFSQKGLV